MLRHASEDLIADEDLHQVGLSPSTKSQRPAFGVFSNDVEPQIKLRRTCTALPAKLIRRPQNLFVGPLQVKVEYSVESGILLKVLSCVL